MTIRVVGVGEPLAGDDAVGIRVIDRLRALGVPEGIELSRVRDPSLLPDLLCDATEVVVVDALLDPERAGTTLWWELSGNDREMVLSNGRVAARCPAGANFSTPRFSSHGIDTLKAIELARLLANPGEFPRVLLVTPVIEARAELGADLSPKAQTALEQATSQIHTLLSRASEAQLPVGLEIQIRGQVQGVGFRPYTYRLAGACGVNGRIRNDGQGVSLAVFGARAALAHFLERLKDELPAQASIRELKTKSIAYEPVAGFVIESSAAEPAVKVWSIPADLATCAACVAEIEDPNNRRYRYPFTNCTACGPRFTISTGIPYDRQSTEMAPFAMCAECRREYDDPADRRFHAEANACPACGPRLELIFSDGGETSGAESRPSSAADPIAQTAKLLSQGKIIALKGLGGFHLACEAQSAVTVSSLRARKHRDEKPFAVMVKDLEAARELVELGPAEAELLESPERPIVLIRRRAGASIAREVAPDGQLLGVFLPYTPLHHLLLQQCDGPLVMTSANLASEPIVASNEEALEQLHGIADAFLVHDRRIAERADDSVARVIDGAPVLWRRSRGYAPRPIVIQRPVQEPILACGAHLKNAFCLAVGNLAYLGPHIGDLEKLATVECLEATIGRFEQLLGIQPRIIAHDLHPGYASTAYARRRAVHASTGTEPPRLIGVQHHHAHIASAMAEHGLVGPVFGIAYDGTGHGTDGTSWGGEILLVQAANYRRLGTFRPIGLPGGNRAMREIWRIALSAVYDAFEGEPPLDRIPLFQSISADTRTFVEHMLSRGLQTPGARGVGRLFDAVGALVLDRPQSTYEGQVAIAFAELADHASRASSDPYPFAIDVSPSAADETHSSLEIDTRPLFRAVVGDLLKGTHPARISARFHQTLVNATSAVIERAALELGPLPIILSGGCFQNPTLLTGLRRALAPRHAVHAHRQVPPGDGGIALGQVVVADAIVRR